MNADNKKSLIQSFQNFVVTNYKIILSFAGVLIVIIALLQIYFYFSNQALKKTSIQFFNLIDKSDEIIQDLNSIKEKGNFYSVLSSLKLIEKNNENKDYFYSNELYKELLNFNKIEVLYKSSISAHASYTMIEASYHENSLDYIEDIKFYINNIDDSFESFTSIKKELQYLLIITELDLTNSEYKNNTEVLEMYNDIYNSNLISSTVKERVKKIHEFQLYK
tara:strand:- start:1629 stop:2291 length:663 start_codon:yes stop_codon:yes gene_type:complete